MRKILRKLSPERHKIAEKLLLDHLAADKDFLSAARVMLYYAMPSEVSTELVLARWSQEKKFYLPTLVDGKIQVRLFEGKEKMRQGQFNIWEPITSPLEDLASLDYILVPGVAFDYQGHRLGHGKAYYDCFLSQSSLQQARYVGVAFSEQVLPQIPTEVHDVPLPDLIIV